jgi:hypothetical protein
MLGVVLTAAGFTGDPMSQPAAQPLKNFVTQWGNDPVWSSPFVTGVGPKRSNFPRARTAPDAAGAWLPAFAPADEADQPPGSFMTTGLEHPELRIADPTARVEVAPHDVFYDTDRQLWYSDIEVSWGVSYYPFIRLALARYQPVSVLGAHLSHIVLADFMPLVPDRWLTVAQTKDPRTRRVSVFGPTFSDSSPHAEAVSAPQMSRVVPDGSTITLKAPEVAPSSVVEVSVERNDPALGEDFGWRRDPDVVVHRDTTPIRRSAEARSAARAKELRPRSLGQQLQAGLPGPILLVPPLWEGSVTLPPPPGSGTRYRLAIAEYEEYLIDDATPYDAIPTLKDRRLVFIEYVELT